MLQRLGTYLQHQLSLDIRALGWMRICLGLVLIADWLIRMQSLEAHYTNAGVLPQPVLFDYQWKEGYFSLFILSDSIAWQYFLFFTALLFSFFFTIGYFTRFSNLIVWILLCSIHARNPFILQAGDELFRIALLWGLFLPLGRACSVDALHKSSPLIDTKLFSVAGIGLLLLVTGVYFFSALQKTSPEWRTDGTAIYYALSLDQMVLPPGKKLLDYPELCKLLTHLVFYIELIAPLLFFIPWKNKLFRNAGILALILLHIGIGTTLFVGLFFCIGISTLIGLLPAATIDALIIRKPRFLKHLHPIVFFARILPSFSSLRNAGTRLLELVSNFYSRTLLNFTLLFVICICLIWNLGNVHGTGLSVTGPFWKMAYFLRLDENWGMFSPGVFKDDGWFVLEGESDYKNAPVDVYRNSLEVSYAKPDYILGDIADDRWRKFGENYIMSDYAYIRPAYCRYMLNKWNDERRRQPIHSLQVIYMKETTPPPGEKATITKELLCTCKK